MLSMWEFGMDGGRYDVTEFRNRHLTLPALDDDSVQPESLLSRSALQLNATTKCIIEAHAILDCFIGIATDTLQKAPNLLFVRAVYALVVLMKADYAVGTDPEMGEVLDSQSLKVDAYLATVLAKSSEAIGPHKCRMPTHWTFVLEAKLMPWRDEYLAWRSEGRHLKRRKVQSHNEARKPRSPSIAAPTAHAEPTHPHLGPPHTHASHPQPASLPGSSFPLPNAYAWPAVPGPPLGAQEHAAFPPDMGDFSAAFQNGDLYLWNEITDNFGGWMPQGGGDVEMGSGPLNGQY